ncbi:hypothetical protein AMK59_677 [Oryctes borbonicus]|uniref:Uncharacterized protein n=1 Tax=Oryctes borbonicus TaxID=1629725 RepID=A0A0T6BFN4_9SCAR|nr:hypothetical protein AMK59_677 [Oryctes borbonicus]
MSTAVKMTTTTNHAGRHHLWRPLAAIQSREFRSYATASSRYSRSGSPIFNNKAMVSGLVAVMNNVSAASTDEENSVWYKIENSVRGSGNALFGQTNSTTYFDSIFNGSWELFDLANQSNSTGGRVVEDTFELLTMVGTAVILGLLILATVIGK